MCLIFEALPGMTGRGISCHGIFSPLLGMTGNKALILFGYDRKYRSILEKPHTSDIKCRNGRTPSLSGAASAS